MPNISNPMFGDLHWHLNASRGFVSICWTLVQKRTDTFSKSVTQNKWYTDTLRAFIWFARNNRFRVNIRLTPFTPLFNSRIDNILVSTAQELNHLLFQFINALDVCMAKTFLHDHSYLIVNWIDFLSGLFRHHKSSGIKPSVSVHRPQQFDSDRNVQMNNCPAIFITIHSKRVQMVSSWCHLAKI